LSARWRTAIGLAISGLFLWWAFHGEDLGAIGRRLASADPLWLLAAGGISTVGGLIRAIRWRLLLVPLGVESGLYSRWAALNIGFMVTNVYPGRLGEIVRPLALSRMTSVSFSGALGTVVLERVLDTVALVLLLLITLLSPTFPSGATVLGRPIGLAVTGAIILAVTALVILGLVIAWPSALVRVARKITSFLPGHVGEGMTEKVESFVQGLQLLRQPSALLQAIGWSLFLWVWMAASFWAGFRAFGIELDAIAALFTQCAVSVFVAIPAGPGFIGTMQAGIAVSVQEVFGVSADQTLSLALGYHFAGYVPVTALGLYYASRLGLRLKTVESEVEAAKERED
jgi:uncharacterized protein (TIRG00374 family)